MNNLKPLQNELTKAKIREIYNNIPREELTKLFDSFVQRFLQRNQFSSRTNKCKIIYFNELVEIVSIYGTPKGYYLTADFEKALQQLKMESQQKNYKHISYEIEKCITEIRQQFIELHKDKQLQQNEVLKEKLLIIRKIAFTYNLEASFIERIIGYKNEENETTSQEI